MAFKEKSDMFKYNNEFNKSNYDRINLTMPKGNREIIKAAAERQGESVNAYINGAIAARMAREGHGGGFGFQTLNDTQK